MGHTLMWRALIPSIDYLAAAIHFGMGVYVFSLDRKSGPNRMFGVLAVVFAYWSLVTGLYTAAESVDLARLLYMAVSPAWIVGPLLFYVFVLGFSRRTTRGIRAVHRYATQIAGLALVVAFLIRLVTGPLTVQDHVLTRLGWAEVPHEGLWNTAATVYFLFYTVAGLVSVVLWARREGGTARKQARMIVASGLVSIVAMTAAERILPMMGYRMPPLGPVCAVVWTLGIAYSINRYRFMALSPAAAATEIVRSMTELLLMVTPDGKVRVANRAALRVMGFSSEKEIVGREIRELFPDGAQIGSISEEPAEEDPRPAREVQYRTADGRVVYLSVTTTALRDVDGDRVGISLIMRDVTAERAAQDELHHLATHDILTGLPNRALLRETLSTSLARAKRDGASVGVLLIDLDHFKQVNDTLGHHQGDRLLLEVSGRLRRQLRDADIIGRLGGDEFLIVLTAMKTADDAALVAGRILTSLEHPIALDGADLHVTCSIGMSTYPTDGDSVDILIRNADIAMYRAKERRNAYTYFATPLQTAVTRRMAMEIGLRQALARGEMELLYQPLFDPSGVVSGLEALLRWNHPEWGELSAMDFLPVAEKTGLLAGIGAWVLRSACTANAEWQRHGLPKVPVSVNVTARQVCRSDFLETLTGTLADTGLDPSCLRLEIAESTLRDAKDVEAALLQLSRRGVRVIMDNYGTGGCPLARLPGMAFKGLKIDRSLLRDAMGSAGTAYLVSSIISLAHALGMDAEVGGVESAQHLAFLRELHRSPLPAVRCDGVQGFLLGRPLDMAAVRELLERRAPPSPLIADV